MSNYKGQLEGFPSEVVEKMLERQVEQGNKKDVGVFEKFKWATGAFAGFRWANTKEGDDFWREVIEKRNFNLFFSRYPKKDKFTPISEETGNKLAEAMEEMREIQQNIAMNIKKADELLNFTSNSNMGELTFSSEWQPKEGDVVTTESPRGKTISIFKSGEIGMGDIWSFYAALHYADGFLVDELIWDIYGDAKIRLATREERCTFFSRLVNEGYKWNAKKLKLTKWVPKDGDFVYTPANSVVIYKSGEPAIITYCGINFFGDLDTNTGIGFGCIDGCRKATNSERQRLLDALRKEGKTWNADKKRIEDIKPIYSIGDIILANDGSIAIISEIREQRCYEISAVLISNSELRINNNNNISMMFISDFIKRKANKQEVSKLNEALAKAGYRRSAKMGAIEPLKWRPKMGERYFVPSKKSKYGFNESIWSGSEFDVAYESIGIICRTGEEAQKMLK